MNLGKETIIAAVVGFAVGLAAAWAVWQIPQLLPKKEAPTTFEETAPETTSAFTLTLNQPEDEAILDTAEASVSGKTEKGATVVVNGPLTDEVVEAGDDGSFSTTVKLEEGANEIVVTAYPAGEGEERSVTRTVSYTKEEI